MMQRVNDYGSASSDEESGEHDHEDEWQMNASFHRHSYHGRQIDAVGEELDGQELAQFRMAAAERALNAGRKSSAGRNKMASGGSQMAGSDQALKEYPL